ncbi:MAG TPA: helix-turn-helix domain-containing protein [Candidatus Dormibacteraeota bacterium]|nr:helix-turn-helix domain-containing protein [Candidatus Dormibacteraeota bacterium]
MATVRRTLQQIRDHHSTIDQAKVDSFTEEDIARMAREDDSETDDIEGFYFVPALVDVRALREKLGLSQRAFAARFHLSVRTVQGLENRTLDVFAPTRIALAAAARVMPPKSSTPPPHARDCVR